VTLKGGTTTMVDDPKKNIVVRWQDRQPELIMVEGRQIRGEGPREEE